ncbi:hypothetical protein WME89_18305 [Sorangium sp. So ce321]|uniref:hypothetical protein n=1 Tax=Sorangium sp. So ce321 TaxID=3133300 RepID=UPI003F61A92C
MFVVAILELATSVEAEAAALAADLGSTAYEQRLHLVAGLPAVVLTTADPAPARALLRSLRARGHGALAVDAAAVVSSGDMLLLRRGRLEPGGLAAEDPTASGVAVEPAAAAERLPFDDILALIRATQRQRVTSKVEVKERKFAPGSTMMTGGLVMSKTVTREETRVSDERSEVLYLFRKSGERPWLLRERGASYGWLGGTMAPSSLQNFTATVALLRQRAPGAVYDERLTGARRQIPFSGNGSPSPDPNADLLAHLLACWAARASAPGGGAAAPG